MVKRNYPSSSLPNLMVLCRLAEILGSITNKTNVPAVTKFAYLREFLDAKVRKTVEALPPFG